MFLGYCWRVVASKFLVSSFNNNNNNIQLIHYPIGGEFSFNTSNTVGKMLRSPKKVSKAVERANYIPPSLRPLETVPIEEYVKEARNTITTISYEFDLSGSIKTELKTAVKDRVGHLNNMIVKLCTVIQKQRGKSSKSDPLPNVSTAEKENQTINQVEAAEEDPKLTSEEVLVKWNEIQKVLDCIKNDQKVMSAEMKEITNSTRKIEGNTAELKEILPTYAQALAGPSKNGNERAEECVRQRQHAIMVSSKEDQDTSELVIEKVRTTLDARKEGFCVQRVSKVRDRKVVISCGTKEELNRIGDRLKGNGKLNVEEVKSKDPLVRINGMLTYNTEADVIMSLKTNRTNISGRTSSLLTLE